MIFLYLHWCIYGAVWLFSGVSWEIFWDSFSCVFSRIGSGMISIGTGRGSGSGMGTDTLVSLMVCSTSIIESGTGTENKSSLLFMFSPFPGLYTYNVGSIVALFSFNVSVTTFILFSIVGSFFDSILISNVFCLPFSLPSHLQGDLEREPE